MSKEEEKENDKFDRLIEVLEKINASLLKIEDKIDSIWRYGIGIRNDC